MSSIWTLSNMLSFSRVVLLIPFLYFLSQETQATNYIALAIGLVAAATDFFDGLLARRFHTVTTLGKYLDPIADKIGVLATAIYLTYYRKNMAAWFTWLLIFKDVLLIMGGAYLIFIKRIVIQAEMAGKWTVCMVSLMLIFYILNQNRCGDLFSYISLAFIIHSTIIYVRKFKSLLTKII